MNRTPEQYAERAALLEYNYRDVKNWWQVVRYTAAGPVLLGLYGGGDAEARARASGAHEAGASVERAPGVVGLHDALTALARSEPKPAVDK